MWPAPTSLEVRKITGERSCRRETSLRAEQAFMLGEKKGTASALGIKILLYKVVIIFVQNVAQN